MNIDEKLSVLKSFNDNDNDDEIAEALQHQFWHLLSLLTLLVGILLLVNKDDSLLLGELGGVSSATWMILAILSPIVHQFYVLVCWRLELHYKCITKAFGANGFKLYKIGFAILILSRLVTIIMLAISNRSTLSIDPVLAYLIAGILLIPSVYLFYSVQKHVQVFIQCDVCVWIYDPMDSRFLIDVGSCYPGRRI